jgi:hypothetical protein
MRSCALIVISVAGLTLPAPALASIIFTTGGSPPTFSSNLANSYHIDQDPTAATPSAVAESFVPTVTVGLGEIDLAVANISGPNELMVLIESGVSAPTTVLESFNTTAPATPSIFKIMSVQRPQLTQGTTYWLVLTTTGTTIDYWFVDPFGPRGTSVQDPGSSTWIPVSAATQGSAELLSAVPEPSSAGLISLGAALVMVGSLNRRRR